MESKHVTKHFPHGIVFSTYILRHVSFFHPFISCLSEILKCQNTPLHTTKWQRKRRILFGMYNWKWMNLSKIRQDKNISDKKYNLSLRLVLFCSLPRFFLIGPLQLSLSTVKRTKLYRSNVRDVSIFYKKNSTLWSFLDEYLKSNSQGEVASSCTNRERWEFWLDVSFFSNLKKHRSRVVNLIKVLQVSSISVAIVFRL